MKNVQTSTSKDLLVAMGFPADKLARLAAKTHRRILAGIRRYSLDIGEPRLVVLIDKDGPK